MQTQKILSIKNTQHIQILYMLGVFNGFDGSASVMTENACEKNRLLSHIHQLPHSKVDE